MSCRLSDEIDSLRNQPVRDSDEELFELRETCQRLQADLNILRTDRISMQQELDEKTLLIQRYEFDTKKQIEAVDQLNQKVCKTRHCHKFDRFFYQMKYICCFSI